MEIRAPTEISVTDQDTKAFQRNHFTNRLLLKIKIIIKEKKNKERNEIHARDSCAWVFCNVCTSS